eukprot:532512_1
MSARVRPFAPSSPKTPNLASPRINQLSSRILAKTRMNQYRKYAFLKNAQLKKSEGPDTAGGPRRRKISLTSDDVPLSGPVANLALNIRDPTRRQTGGETPRNARGGKRMRQALSMGRSPKRKSSGQPLDFFAAAEKVYQLHTGATGFSPRPNEKMRRLSASKSERRQWEIYGRAWYLFGTESKIRRLAASIVYHPFFDNGILVLIILSSLIMALQHPGIDPRSVEGMVMDIAQIIIAVLFTLEALLRSLTLGFTMHHKSYLRDPWNRLDFFIVVITLLDYLFTAILGDTDIGFVRSLRLLRALRPLRFVNRSIHMRVAVSALFKSVVAVGNLILMCLVIWLVFGILGVSMFSGMFYSCNDPSVQHMSECVGTFNVTSEFINEALVLPREWANSRSNFDNIGAAFLTLFSITTLDGWISVAER